MKNENETRIGLREEKQGKKGKIKKQETENKKKKEQFKQEGKK